MGVLDINLDQSIVVMDDGSAVPITNIFDGDGEECGREFGVVAVAGPDPDGMWHTIALSEFSSVSIN